MSRACCGARACDRFCERARFGPAAKHVTTARQLELSADADRKR
jgi:hypothetical protein